MYHLSRAVRKAVFSPAASQAVASRCYSAKDLKFGSIAREEMIEGWFPLKFFLFI